MKHLIRFLACSAIFAALALPAWAQGAVGGTAETTNVTQQDDPDAPRIAMYTEFYTLRKAGDNDKAYDKGKEFLQKYPTPEDQYFNAIKKFVVEREKQLRLTEFYNDLKASKYDEAFALADQVLADAPDNATKAQRLWDITRAGQYAATGDSSGNNKNTKNNAATINYGNQLIALVNSGTVPKTGTKDKVLGDTYFALHEVTEKPEDQIPLLLKAAQTQAYAKDPALYFNLALAYQEGEFTKNEKIYNDLIADKTKTADTPEVQTALKAYRESADRLIDALARTIVYATTPELAPYKNNSMTLLTGLYKFRNKSDAGLQAFINGITAKPLPQPGQPIDYFPPPAPATPAASTTGATATTGTPAAGDSATAPKLPATTPMASTTTKPAAATTAKPAATQKPVAAKPKKRGTK